MTVPENSSSTSMTTVSYGSSRPLGPSRNRTRGRLIDELEAFAAQGLDEHAELELAAAGDLEAVVVGGHGDADRDIALGLALEAVADDAALDLVAVAPGIGAVVDARSSSPASAGRSARAWSGALTDGIGDGVGDGRLDQAGDGDDLARLGAVDRHALEPAEGEDLGRAAFLDEVAVRRRAP